MADHQKDPKYLLVETEREVERLTKQHNWIQTCLGGQIVFAPLDLQKDGLRVLDIGCADGTLLRDLQKQVSPSAELVGADLMTSFFPKENPSGNIHYQSLDICEPFPADLQQAFDLTHIRHMLAGAAKVGLDAAIKNSVSSVAPGGWLQVQELDLPQDSPSYTPALKDMIFIMRALFDKIGMGPNFSNRLESVFKDTGLENVTTRRVELPLGKKLGNATEISNSIDPFRITIPSIISGAKGAGAELPNTVTDDLQARFEKEMLEQGGSFHALIITGQKKST